jgi:hypothetical protein
MGQISPRILNRINSVSKEDIERKRKSGLDEERSLKKNTSGRNSSSDVIVFDIYEEDDLIVETVKLAVNKAQITLDSIYEKVGRGAGWNMYYGLLQRHTATVKTFQAWAEILECGVIIKLVPRK